MQWVFIAHVPTIIIPITQPVGFHTDVGVGTLEMVWWAGDVARATGVGLVRGDVVLAVVHAVTHLW